MCKFVEWPRWSRFVDATSAERKLLCHDDHYTVIMITADGVVVEEVMTVEVIAMTVEMVAMAKVIQVLIP